MDLPCFMSSPILHGPYINSGNFKRTISPAVEKPAFDGTPFSSPIKTGWESKSGTISHTRTTFVGLPERFNFRRIMRKIKRRIKKEFSFWCWEWARAQMAYCHTRATLHAGRLQSLRLLVGLSPCPKITYCREY